MEKILRIDLGNFRTEGDLNIPENPKALVVFAHGSGSGRYSPRNRWIAEYLNQRGFATFLFDLTESEEKNSGFFDLRTYSERLEKVSLQLLLHSMLKGLPLVFFGGSTGAAVAICAATKLPRFVSAVISRGGRTDLATHCLDKANFPTLLIVGEADREVLRLNEASFDLLPEPKTLEIIPKASHLFEEPGTLEAVAKVTVDWLKDILSGKNIPKSKKLR
jgi:putative phosphoribosyl transferase